MSLQFEGDIRGLSDKQRQFISDVLTGLGFTNNRVVFKLVTKLGDSDASSVHRITVKTDDGEDFKMIAKIAPKAEAVRARLGTGINFSNEIAMYKQVLPKFARVQTNADVADEDRFKYPKCYGCLSEEPHEVVLLEDLKVSNYVMLDMFTSLSNDAVKLVLKKFTMLHALSFAMKKYEPGIYDILQSKLVNIWNKASVSEEFKAFFNEIENSVLEVLDDDKYIKAVRGLVAQTISQITKIEKYEMNSKHLVIQHGDAWTNNLMFKFEDEKLTDNIMIDYRSSCQGNPVGDILYMVFSCTDHATRSQHFHNWIDYYHDQLDNSLSNFGMKASFVYPKEQLDADLKRYSKIYFGTSILLFNLMCKTGEEVSQMADAKNNPRKTGPNVDINNLVKIYKTKIEDLVDSYREFGFLA